MLANPYISVQSKNKVNVAGQGDEVRFQTPDQDWRDSDKLAIAKLWISAQWALSSILFNVQTLPYFSDRVCNDMAPSEKNA